MVYLKDLSSVMDNGDGLSGRLRALTGKLMVSLWNFRYLVEADDIPSELCISDR